MVATPASSTEYLITIGKLVHNSTANELFMFAAFKILSGCPSVSASAIFYTLDSFQGKKSLLKRVVKATGDKEDEELLEQIIEAAEKSNNQRNEVSHAITVWKTLDLDSTFSVFHPKSDNAKPATKAWLASLVRYSHEAFVAGNEALQRLSKKHGVPATLELQSS